jgi:ABC-2 type transport system ATP-binding protein
MNVIEADGLVKQYDGVRALDSVSFAVGEGEVFALVGPNGAGKTTLLRLLTDILRPDAGTLMLLGHKRLREVLGRIGYMPEERGLYKALSPLETVSYFAQLKGMRGPEAKAAAERALEAVGMIGHAKRKLEELSKGMSQRVQFAATIAHDPQLLILDEPFSGLDPVSARDLQQLILHQRDTGHTVLLSTHNMEHAEKLCDRLLMLHRGQVRLYGSIGEIKERYTDDSLLVEYGGSLPEVPGVRVEATGEGSARLYPNNGTGRNAILAALVAGGADIRKFEPVVPTLEDIFIQVAGAEGEKALRETQAVA